MKRPIFLTIWLVIMLLLSVAMTVDSLTYIRFILLTKSYLSFIGIIAGFVEIFAFIQLLRWKKVGVNLLVSSMAAVFMVTAIDQPYVVSKLSQAIVSMLIVLAINLILLGILYLAIKPVWKNFK